MNKLTKLELFKRNFLLCKQNVVASFDAFVEHHRETDNEEEYSESKRSVLLGLCDKFRHALVDCRLPDLKDDWWFYQYEVTNDSIDLSLNYCSEVEFDSDGNLNTMTSSPEFTLLSVKCDYLTAEEYATLYDVSPTTVRQWIRRGKLRTAKKLGRDWIIPSLADKPKRGFESASYSWTHLPRAITDDFPFLNGYEVVYIFQDESDKSQFYCILGWPGSNNRSRVSLSLAEREKLELALISTNNVCVEESNAMFVPFVD